MLSGRGESVLDVAGKIHATVQDAGHIDALAGDRINHHMLFDGERPVTIGKVGAPVSKARIVGDRRQCAIEGGGVNLLLPVSIGFVGVL